jgi:ribosomal protein S18 acetylase RimI-like enzyme
VNIRPATVEDAEFLRTMLYEAATWNPDWPRGTMEEVLAEPTTVRYHEGWGRPGDVGVVAELAGVPAGVPVGAAWYRLFTPDAPGYGFVDDRTPELGIAVDPLHRRRGIGHALLYALMAKAKEEGLPALSLSVAACNRSRKMYEEAGFEKVGVQNSPDGEYWTMRLRLS